MRVVLKQAPVGSHKVIEAAAARSTAVQESAVRAIFYSTLRRRREFAIAGAHPGRQGLDEEFSVADSDDIDFREALPLSHQDADERSADHNAIVRSLEALENRLQLAQ